MLDKDLERKPYLPLRKVLEVIQESNISDIQYNYVSFKRENWSKIADKNVIDISADQYGIVIIVGDL